MEYAGICLRRNGRRFIRSCAARRPSRKPRPGRSTRQPGGLAQKASQEIAEIAGVSARTVDDALAVQKADPELFQQVKDGKVSVSAAAKQVRAPKPEPDEPPAEKPKPKSDQASKVVELFRMMGDRRLGTLKQVIKTLESHERRVLLDFLEALVEGES
jgi:hypothetical protein